VLGAATVTELRQDLVLVGGGHSHALVLRMLAMKPIGGLRITLVSPASHTPYSGMLPGLIAGHYTFEQTHIDLARLCQWAGVRFIAAAVTAVDPDHQTLTLAGRPSIDYDLLSLDIGSQPELDSVPGARLHAVPVKPVSSLWQRWQALYERIQALGAAGQYRVSIVGGGAGSVEVAMAMSHRLQGQPVTIDLWCGAAEILQGYNASAQRSVMAALQRHGIAVHLDARVTQVEDASVVLADGSRHSYEELFWCAGAAAAGWVATSGLPTDDRGFLAVTDTLQSTAYENVFGAGDIATQLNHPRPKAGVFAVRQAPVLAHNLRASLLDKPLRQHRPQQRFLSLVSLGDKTATADKGFFSVTGAWVWRWKDRIDRAFMARFEDLPDSMPLTHRGRLPELESISAQAVCGGCGAKVGADALAGALAQLKKDFPQHCTGGGDDAVAIPAPTGAPVVQSLDLLRQIVSDPWQMGRIAANHALSDLYACGARPVSALAAVTLPYAGSAVLQRDLEQLLAGALQEFSEVDCQLNGGHSMQGAELGLGFVVNGVPIAADGSLLAKTGAAVGDQLVLTKALGSGTLFAAHMQLAADGRDIEAAVESMMQGNGAAAELALSHGASACTDITGFGLLGHLLEMLSGELGAQLDLAALPLLDGALQSIEAGILSTMYPANVASSARFMGRPAHSGDARLRMIFDPQTSGGLLIAVAPERARALCDDLRECGYHAAEIVGELTAVAADAVARVQLR
jgi:selenide,water dikinase